MKIRTTALAFGLVVLIPFPVPERHRDQSSAKARSEKANLKQPTKTKRHTTIRTRNPRSLDSVPLPDFLIQLQEKSDKEIRKARARMMTRIGDVLSEKLQEFAWWLAEYVHGIDPHESNIQGVP